RGGAKAIPSSDPMHLHPDIGNGRKSLRHRDCDRIPSNTLEWNHEGISHETPKYVHPTRCRPVSLFKSLVCSTIRCCFSGSFFFRQLGKTRFFTERKPADGRIRMAQELVEQGAVRLQNRRYRSAPSSTAMELFRERLQHRDTVRCFLQEPLGRTGPSSVRRGC